MYTLPTSLFCPPRSARAGYQSDRLALAQVCARVAVHHSRGLGRCPYPPVRLHLSHLCDSVRVKSRSDAKDKARHPRLRPSRCPGSLVGCARGAPARSPAADKASPLHIVASLAVSPPSVPAKIKPYRQHIAGHAHPPTCFLVDQHAHPQWRWRRSCPLARACDPWLAPGCEA